MIFMKHTLFQTFTLLVLALTAACTPYDTIIRNGTVYDGSGQAGIQADVGIRGNKIVKIGNLSNARARTEIDAAGKAVSPGFVNMLSWANESLLYDGRSMSDVKQGVTLEVMGEGWSMGPLNEKMKKERPGKTPWTTLGQYLQHLEKKGVSVNVASFVGATTVRINVLGYDNRQPNEAELKQMQDLVRQAMEEGALGVGSSLVYPPAFFASTEELIALCKVASEYQGMYISHLRSEGNRLLQAADELMRIAQEANIRAEFYHLKASGKDNWPKMDLLIQKIDSAQKAGLRVAANMYTYTAGSTGLDACLPPWVQDGGYAKFLERLRDSTTRAQVVAEMRQNTDKWENFYALAGSPDNILLVGFVQDSLRKYTGKTVAQVAAMRGTAPEETVIDLLLQNRADISTVFFLMNEENVKKQIALLYMTFCSDGGSLAAEGGFLKTSTHPRAYGNFARLLGKYVREEKVIPIAEAVRRLSAMPCERLGIEKRGQLKPGFFADVVIFDPATINDKATFEQPHQYAEGVEYVWVNGTPVILKGQHTRLTPGRAVYGKGKK
jgi:N-acyl-D-amino-acid deacylase